VKRSRRTALGASLLVFATGPAAGLALPWLRRAGLIADAPLVILFALLVACSASNAVVQIVEPRLSPALGLHLRLAVGAFSTAWFTYACGWGSLVVIAYAITIADAMRLHGSRAWRPGLGWCTFAIAVGQACVALGVTPSVLRPSIAHCTACVTFVCLVILVRTLGASAQATEAATAKVENGRAYFRDLVQHAADVIALVNNDFLVEYISPGIEDLARRAPGWCIGRRIDDVLGPQAGADITRAYDNLTLSDYISCEWLLTNEFGEHRRVLARLTLRVDGSLVLNLRDVTEQRALEEQLERRARLDSLTGLPNRASLMQNLEKYPTVEAVSVLFIDLDGFKEVNDSLGHERGDRVLRDIAERITRALPPDVEVGRLGGDEFLAITRMRDVTALEKLAQDIIATVEELGRVETRFPLAASIGVAMGGHADSIESLLHRADQAMYCAKASGPGRVVVAQPREDTADVGQSA
jgi:diguanylate cyclase (GGDEF)-like protein